MTDLDDRWAAALRQQGRGAAPTPDVWRSIVDREPADVPHHSAGRPSRLLLVAAVVLVVAAIAGALAVAGGGSSDHVDTGDSPTTITPIGTVPLELLHRGLAPPATPLRAATSSDQLRTMWTALDLPPADRPAIDFDREVVVAVGLPDDRCPSADVEAVRTGTEVELRTVEPAGGCAQRIEGRTIRLYVAALDREDLPDPFTLHRPATPRYGYDEQELPVSVAPPRTSPQARVGGRIRVDGSLLPPGMRFIDGPSSGSSGGSGTTSTVRYGTAETAEARFARAAGPWTGDGPYLRIVLRVNPDLGLDLVRPADADLVNVQGVGGHLTVGASSDPAVPLPDGSDSSRWLSITWPAGDDRLVTVQAEGIDRDDLIDIVQTVAVSR